MDGRIQIIPSPPQPPLIGIQNGGLMFARGGVDDLGLI